MGVFQSFKNLRFGRVPAAPRLSEAPPPTSNQADEQSLYSTDRPIHSKKADRFNRARFAERIGDTLAKRHDSSSIVIGLYGPWGDGKTSTLHLIEEHLRTYPHVVVIHFNPWHFGSHETLIKGFFTTLAKELGRSLTSQTEKLKGVLERYGSLLSNLPIPIDLGKAATTVGKAISSADLETLKKRVNEALQEAKKRVVVMIDDIDRLDRAEIHEMLKLVKLSADFSYMSYVLAFDDEMVAQSVGGMYGSGDTEAGRRFLEKIVQVPLQLPPADQLSLRQFAIDRINEALQVSGISLSDEQAQAFMRHFVDGIEPQMSTPRHAARYGNALIFSLPLLKGEVDVVDHMLLEGLRVFYLPLYKVIRDNPEYFLKEARDPGSRRDDAHVNTVKEAISTALTESGARDREGVRTGLLEILFPRLKGIFGNWSFGPESEEVWYRQKKITSADYFPRYFAYGLPTTDVSDIAVTGFLSELKSLPEADSVKRFAALANGRDIARVIGKLRRYEGTIDGESAVQLVTIIASNSQLIPKDRTMMFANFTRMQVAGLIQSLLKRIPTDERESSTEFVIRTAVLPFAFEVFQSVRTVERDGGEVREGPLPAAAEARLAQILVDRIRADNQGAPLYRTWNDDARALYWVWQTYGDSNEVSTALQAQLQSGKTEVAAFLDIFVGWAYGLESGLARRSDLARETYDAIAKLINPEFVLVKLRELYGPVLDSPSMHPDPELPVEQRVAAQFAFIHQKVNESREHRTDDPNRFSGPESKR